MEHISTPLLLPMVASSFIINGGGEISVLLLVPPLPPSILLVRIFGEASVVLIELPAVVSVTLPALRFRLMGQRNAII